MLALQSVYPFPTGAGSCDSGSAAVLNPLSPHGFLPNIGGGGLSDKGYTVLLEGKQLFLEGVNEVPVGAEYEIELSGDYFRGFLIRLDGDADATEALWSDDANVQTSDHCVASANVGGLTHTNRSDKNGISASLQFSDPGT